MMDKEKLHQILSSLWKNDKSVGKTYYNQALQDVQIAIDSLQEEPKTDWLQELQEKLDSLSKEDFKKVWDKYKLREEGSVDYDKLNTMLDDALAKETKESLNERLGEESKPKFKKGDYIRPTDSCLGAPHAILEVCDSWYVTNQGILDFEYEDNWELVREPVTSVWHEPND